MSERIVDIVQWRALGAIELADGVTNRALHRPVTCTAPGARLERNRADLYVITAAPGLTGHTRAFEAPPETPAPGAAPITVRIEDPLGEFLPRLARIPLPRSSNPVADQPNLLMPERVAMLPAPRRRTAANWSSVRLSLARSNGTPLHGALIELRTTDADARLLGRGLSDERGEAIVAIAGLPLVRAAEAGEPADDITTPTTPARIGLVVDPAQPWPVDPDRLSTERATLRSFSVVTTIQLTAGGAEHRAVVFDP
jgi:hypothetical protein